MNWTLEVVYVPVTDVDRAKEFYADRLGFVVDHDHNPAPGIRIVQLTPPGSGCSICIGTGTVEAEPGSSKGLQLVVPDLIKAREVLIDRGLEVGEITVMSPEGPRDARDGDDLDNIGFLYLADPDGNGWAVQQISSRG